MQLYTQFSLFCTYKIVTFLQLTIVNQSLPNCHYKFLFMYFQIVILMKQSNFPYQIVIYLQLPNCHFFSLANCHYKIVTYMFLPVRYYQIVITKLSLPSCHHTKLVLPNCHFQIVITKLIFPNCHYQIVVTKLSPYQVGITKLSLPSVTLTSWYYQIVTLPSWYFQIVITKLTFPKISPSKKEALLPLINIQLDKYNKKIILAREQVPSGI